MSVQIARPGITFREPERKGRLREAVGRRLTALVERLKRRIEEERRYRQTVRELMSLDDRELDDIGISRARIRELARDLARAER